MLMNIVFQFLLLFPYARGQREMYIEKAPFLHNKCIFLGYVECLRASSQEHWLVFEGEGPEF